ncbi:hypothetical protein C2G38_2039011 [Gigaspora rosea]|uniref:Uncharacterized protein n=1 Tax=Gigaspora rosea TaxID=44941 RepID=A0A397V0J2_9GLOM|nr:hypothetical protein C2G38_2039011 [Gigaspora rosea]
MRMTKGRGRGKGKTRTNSDHKNKKVINIDDFNHIEYLPVASITSLLQKAQAAIDLSLEELWPIPSDLVRIATLLDPRCKDFKWNEFEEKEMSYKLLQTQYDSIKGNFQTNIVSTEQTSTRDCSDNDDFFQALEKSGQ